MLATQQSRMLELIKKNLLVARNQGRYQEIYSRMFQMSTEQSTVSKESRKITPIGNTTSVMNQSSKG